MIELALRKLRLINSKNNFNSILTKKIFVKLNSLEQGDNINDVFRWGCNSTTDSSGEPASEACQRYCVNGPGSKIKNMSFSGSHTPTERYYGSRLKFFENASGKITDMPFDSSKNTKKWRDIDQEGAEKVLEAIENATDDFKKRIIKGLVSFEEILFFYKNLGVIPFQNFSPDDDIFSAKGEICEDPLIIFTGNACRADSYMELGFSDTEEKFLRQSEYSDLEKVEELIEGFFYPNHYARSLNEIYLIPPRSSIYLGRFTEDKVRQLAIKDFAKKKYSSRVSPSLRTSTNVGQEHSWKRSPTKDDRGMTYFVPEYYDNPCSSSRPRLNEYIDDIRSLQNRKMRNITSNSAGKKENEICEILASLGLSVGSKLAIVIPFHNVTETISNIIPSKFSFVSPTFEEVIESSNIEKLYELLKPENRSIVNKWAIIMLTEIRGIEKRQLSIGIPLFSFGFLKNSYYDDYGKPLKYFTTNEKYAIDHFYSQIGIEYSFENIPDTPYGKSGKISTSMTNMPLRVLSHAFWLPDKKLIERMKMGEKTESRKSLYNKLLKLNKSSKHFQKTEEMEQKRYGGKHKKNHKKITKKRTKIPRKKSKKKKHNRNILKFSKRRKR
jgi:hypothetical protein